MEKEVKMIELKILVAEPDLSLLGQVAHLCDMTLNEYIVETIMLSAYEDLSDE
jgi:hypothetical protein